MHLRFTPPVFFGEHQPITSGNIMLPELTSGKTILPACPQSTRAGPYLGAKSGKTMLPGVAKLWVKLHFLRQKCNKPENKSRNF
jgi:hypothetical protein